MSGGILVIRYSALGDVVTATAVLRWLREALPREEVDGLTAAPYESVFAPWCRNVLTLDRGAPRVGELVRLGRLIHRRRYSAVVDLQGKVTSRLLRRAAGAQRHLGPPPRHGHLLERFAAAVTPLGCVRLPAPSVPFEPGEAVMRERVVLIPGARHPTKRWGASRFARLAGMLLRDDRLEVVVAGGPGDTGEVEAVQRQAAAAGLELKVSLSDPPVDSLARLLVDADLVVGGDTGACHLARALGRPTLVLFGPTDPRCWCPPGASRLWRSPTCAPCSRHGAERCSESLRHCLDELAPASVHARVREILESRVRPCAA